MPVGLGFGRPAWEWDVDVVIGVPMGRLACSERTFASRNEVRVARRVSKWEISGISKVGDDFCQVKSHLQASMMSICDFSRLSRSVRLVRIVSFQVSVILAMLV